MRFSRLVACLSAVQALCNLCLNSIVSITPSGHRSTVVGFRPVFLQNFTHSSNTLRHSLSTPSHELLVMILLGKHSLLQVQSDTFIVGLLVVSAARRPRPLCATQRCTSPVVPRSTPATKRSVTLTTCSEQPAPLPCLPCICCLIQTGHPQPSCYSGPVYCGCPCPPVPRQDGIRDKAPTLICCTAALLLHSCACTGTCHQTKTFITVKTLDNLKIQFRIQI